MGLRQHIRTNVVGYVALFFSLSAGAYAAALAPDSVVSRHIRDGQVRSADVADGALTGADVLAGSLTGTEILESTLSEVPNATIAGHGGYGRNSQGAEGGECNPESTAYRTCASVTLNPSASGRALVFGEIRAIKESDDVGWGDCQVGTSTTGGIPGTISRVGHTERLTIMGVSPPLAPGTYSFGIDCNEIYGSVKFHQARVTAVMISPF